MTELKIIREMNMSNLTKRTMMSKLVVRWLTRSPVNQKVAGSIPLSTSLRSINTGMSLVSFVQRLITDPSLTIWLGRWVSIYALMTAPVSER